MSHVHWTHRFLARIILEAETPLAVGSGETDLATDAPVALDANGLPTIPGTGLCGALRHAMARVGFGQEAENTIFGFQGVSNKEGQGSRLIISDAVFLDENGDPCEGLRTAESAYLKWVRERPVRDHVRITHRGAADSTGHGKFDNEIVPRGVRFVVAMELIGSGSSKDQDDWRKILEMLAHPAFRIGGGTRKGYGRLAIVPEGSESLELDLSKKADLRRYLDLSSSLAKPLGGCVLSLCAQPSEGWERYELDLVPESFWLFGSGLPDEETDMAPLIESTVQWEASKPADFSQRQLVIPASAVKGAIRHRTAYHYNRIKEVFADRIDPSEYECHIYESNKAVFALFGDASNEKNERGETHAGRVLLSDVFVPFDSSKDTKIMNHVSIDRFTGGAKNSALFDERVIGKKTSVKFEILVEKIAMDDGDIKKAFESALQDICDGLLPLGGGVMRGHGVFIGEMKNRFCIESKEVSHV